MSVNLMDLKPKPAQPEAAPRLKRVLEGLFQRRVPVGGFLSQAALCALVKVPVAPLRYALRVDGSRDS